MSDIIHESVDLPESNADFAPRGFVRLRRNGGVLQASVDGGAYAGIGGIDGGTVSVLGGAVTDWNLLNGIDGDAEGGWDIWGQVVVNATNNFSLRPNGLTTNLASVLLTVSGTPTGSLNRTDIAIGDGQIADTVVTFHVQAFTKSGQQRIFLTDCWRGGAAYHSFGRWTDTTTKLTSLALHTDAANGILAGSWVKYQKRGLTV